MDTFSTLPSSLLQLPAVVVVCGHYGTGKTNFSLNLAFDMVKNGRATTLVDLDIVNPYFRSSDYAHSLKADGIDLLCPQSANTALDAPMLSVAINEAIEDARKRSNGICIVDAGGDDVGATALGRYAKTIQSGPFAMLYVVNAMRDQTRTPSDAITLLREIESASHLVATHVVNNTHLMDATNEAILRRGLDFAREVSQEAHVPLLCSTVPILSSSRDSDTQRDDNHLDQVHPIVGQSFNSSYFTGENIYFVRTLVRKPWE